MRRVFKRFATLVVIVCADLSLDVRLAHGQNSKANSNPLQLLSSPALSIPVQIVSPLPLPVTGSVGVNGPIQVQQLGAWTFTTQLPIPKRYGPTNIGNQTETEIVPSVAPGATFVATYIHIAGISLNSGSPMVSGSCDAFISAGSTQLAFLIPLQLVDGALAGNLPLSYPLSTGESLKIFCSGKTVTPGPTISWTVTIAGQFRSQ